MFYARGGYSGIEEQTSAHRSPLGRIMTRMLILKVTDSITDYDLPRALKEQVLVVHDVVTRETAPSIPDPPGKTAKEEATSIIAFHLGRVSTNHP